jgi:excinuclease ABC subunit A
LDFVRVRGARENNLQDVDLDLPLRALIVFTGVSGSGKSSLAYDTLHQEGQRRYLEALAAHRRRPGPNLRRPRVDAVLGLPPTIALDQRAGAPDPRATVASHAEVHDLLALVFARAGTQHCPGCGEPVRPRTHDEIVAALLEEPEGARMLLQSPVRHRGGVAVLREIGRAGFSRVSLDGAVLRVEEVSQEQAASARDLRIVVDRIRVAPERRERLHDAVRTTARAGRGVVIAVVGERERVFVDRPYCWRCDRALPALEPRLFNPRSPVGRCETCRGSGLDEQSATTCPACQGTRLREEARAVRWEGRAFSELLAVEAGALHSLASGWVRTPVTETALEELERRLGVLEDLGLSYLSLDRSVAAISTGELQRLRLAGQVGARLSGVLYVLDEPTVGLHSREVMAVVQLLLRLRGAGNTVLVVEHHPLVVAAADVVVDFGPGAGVRGGRIGYQGPFDGLVASGTLTGRWLSGAERMPPSEGSRPRGEVRVRGASAHNLRAVDVDLPIGSLAALFGPSGSGKTALLETVRHHLEAVLGGTPRWLPPVRELRGIEVFERMVVVDQGPSGRSPRSNPATYSGAWDVVRELLAATPEAQVRGMAPAFFSLHVKGGRCEVCRGTGLQRVDLGWLPDVYLACEVCDGRRFNADVLEVHWKGRSADELLRMPAEEAYAFLAGHPRLEAALRALVDVGLGYVPLGQPGHTLSGGEAQRLRIARELARTNRRGGEGTLFLLDDPTVGLHPADVANLVRLFRRLVADGATVWLATHHEGLAEACDRVVRLGPGGGPNGGLVVG